MAITIELNKKPTYSLTLRDTQMPPNEHSELDMRECNNIFCSKAPGPGPLSA
jgi:hypothetical protein